MTQPPVPPALPDPLSPVPEPVRIEMPDPALVALVGASGSGKSMFAARHFRQMEVLSLQGFRALLSADPRDPEAAADALECLYTAAARRLARGQLTVIDAALVRPGERRRVVDLARAHDVAPVAVVLDLPRPLLEARRGAGDGANPAELIAQVAELRRTQRGLTREGFRQVWSLTSPEAVDSAVVSRVPLPVDRRERRGPFDVIGDVHGCLDELRELLTRLGYRVTGDTAAPPPGRTAVFVGDLVDRGPDSAGTLRLVMNMVASGAALCVPGNHDEKLRRALGGRAVQPLHGLDVTLAQLGAAGEAFRAQVQAFVGALPSHLVLDGGRLVVAHGGLPQHYQGRDSERVRRFALYGDVSGRTDEAGLPIRRDWAADYRGERLVVYGHTPVAQPRWVNRTVNIDTGCAFGGALSALRYPELEVLSVPARAQYAVPGRPLG